MPGPVLFIPFGVVLSMVPLVLPGLVPLFVWAVDMVALLLFGGFVGALVCAYIPVVNSKAADKAMTRICIWILPLPDTMEFKMNALSLQGETGFIPWSVAGTMFFSADFLFRNRDGRRKTPRDKGCQRIACVRRRVQKKLRRALRQPW